MNAKQILEIVEDRSRLRGTVVVWGAEETKNGHTSQYFDVLAKRVAPPDTYEDSDFRDLPEPVKCRVTMTLTDGGDNGWIFKNLQSLTGDADLDLDRLDPDHEEAYQLEGKEVTLLAKHDEYNGRVRIKYGFLFPRETRKAKPSRYAEQLAQFRAEQKRKEAERALQDGAY